jgi:hypothetical protein
MSRAAGGPVLHNMSVPSKSIVSVERLILPGRRFRVDLARALGGYKDARLRLRHFGWRAAFSLLARAGEAPTGPRIQANLEWWLHAAVRETGLPDLIGVFVAEGEPRPDAIDLGAAACLAVLARRSGPLYLPRRPFELSLVDPAPLTLFFPEEDGHAARR